MCHSNSRFVKKETQRVTPKEALVKVKDLVWHSKVRSLSKLRIINEVKTFFPENPSCLMKDGR